MGTESRSLPPQPGRPSASCTARRVKNWRPRRRLPHPDPPAAPITEPTPALPEPLLKPPPLDNVDPFASGESTTAGIFDAADSADTNSFLSLPTDLSDPNDQLSTPRLSESDALDLWQAPDLRADMGADTGAD